MKNFLSLFFLIFILSSTPCNGQFKKLKKPKVKVNLKSKKKKSTDKNKSENSKKPEKKNTKEIKKEKTKGSEKNAMKETKVKTKESSSLKEDSLVYNQLVFDLESINDNLSIYEYDELIKNWKSFKKKYNKFKNVNIILNRIKLDKQKSDDKYLIRSEKAILEMQDYIKNSFYSELNQVAVKHPLEVKNSIEIGQYFLPNNSKFLNLLNRVNKIIKKKEDERNAKIARFTKGNPIHAKYVNKTVYSHKKIASHGSEKEEDFLTKITDDTKPLYTRVYLGDIFKKLNGYYDDYLTIEIELDGETIGNGGLKIDLPGKAQSSWFDILLIPTEKYITNFNYNPKNPVSEREFWKMKYMMTLLANKSKAFGVHKLKIHYHILNKINNQYIGEKYIENTIEIALDKDPNHWNKLKVMLDEKQFESVRMMPRTKINAGLEQALKVRFLQEWGAEGWKIKSTRIVGKSYTIEKNSLGVPLGKYITVQLVATKNGGCTLFTFGFGKKYSGGGQYEGEGYIARRDDSSGIKCRNVK